MAKKEKEPKEEVPVSYDLKADDDKTIEEKIEDKMVDLERQSAMSDDVHILDVEKNPPEPGYMDGKLIEAELTAKNDDGKEVKVKVLAQPLGPNPPKDNTIFVNIDGDKLQLYETIIDIDLKQMAEAQISDCASTIFPMLIDESVQLALDEKKIRQPEKRKEEFRWWWVLVLIMIIIPIILITLQVLPGLMGGK